MVSAVAPLNCRSVIAVIGPEFPENLKQNLAKRGVETCLQNERRGSGHATLQAQNLLSAKIQAQSGFVLILAGDAPLITSENLAQIVALLNNDPQCAVAVAAFETPNPTGYGRLVTESATDAQFLRIVEERDATPAEKAIRLCNAGLYAVREEVLFPLLAKIKDNNAQGEYYLTDIIGLAVTEGHRVKYHLIPESEAHGINSRSELARADALMQQRLRHSVMAAGVTLRDPNSVYLCYDSKIGRDCVIEPNVVFGPGVTIGENVEIRAFCHLEGVVIGNGAVIGPFARLRPETEIGANAHIGNFVELKKTKMGAGAKANHLSYLGDATIGAAANIGAGTITCNYDGYGKYPTKIGAGAFIGSNSSLIAPMEIGDGAIIGAGSVLGGFVPADAMALSRSAPEIRPKAAVRFREKHGGK